MDIHIINYYHEAGLEPTRGNKNVGWNGPCPECGGDDRFVIYTVSRSKTSKIPEAGGYWCRICNISGDCLWFMQQFCNRTYPAALEELGLDDLAATPYPRKRGQYGERRRRKSGPGSPVYNGRWTTRPEQHDEFVEYPEEWLKHAEKFVAACHEALLNRQSALDYLADRGVSLALVRKFRLGFNAGQVSKTKGSYQPAYRQASAWGMPNLARSRDGARQKTISMQAGLTIPCYQGYGVDGTSGNLLRINIRPFWGDYRIVKGSLHFSQAQIIINPGKEIALVVESEFDGIALSSLLPDVTIICMGSAGGRPGEAAAQELRSKQLILLCLDRDISTQKNINEHQAKFPGSPAPVFALGAGVDRAPEEWFNNYPQCQPWYCPAPHKDPGDAIKAGCDMGIWFRDGVAYYSVCSVLAASVAQNKKGKKNIDEEGGCDVRPVSPGCPEWAWLIGYLMRRKIDVKVVGRVVSLVFTRADGQAEEGELERVSAAMGMPEIDGYLSQAKDGVWAADQF